MSKSNTEVVRIHGFDALRAIMMMLGLVIHSSMGYSDVDYGRIWPFKDIDSQSHFFHNLVVLIHVFRMPAFFVVAGFFGALLFYKKSPKIMIMNRVHRIVYPLLVALFILWPIIVFSFNFSNLIMSGSENSIGLAIDVLFPYGWIPENTIHLWFLYYLFLISAVTWLLGLLQRRLSISCARLKAVFELLHGNTFLAVISFGLISFISMVYMNSSFAITSSGFAPDSKTFIFYTTFFWYGWVLYSSRQLIQRFTQHPWWMLLLGTVLFLLKIYLDSSDTELSLYLAMLANSFSTWFYIFAVMGLFLIYASDGSLLLRYISDSAYWVYLVHLPIIVLLAGLLSVVNMPVVFKFLIVLFCSTAICFLTYHYFVRASFIGKFLNGKKYPNTNPFNK